MVPTPPVCKTAMLEDEDGEDVDEADEDEPEDSDSDSDSDSDADSEDPEEAAELAEPVSLASESAAELPGAVTHDTAVLPSMVVTSLASPAALESMVEMDAGIIHVLAPTTEHNEVAKNVALATSSPLQFWAMHWPTNPDHCGITQKQPVSQYGHGVLLVENFKQDFIHSGARS